LPLADRLHEAASHLAAAARDAGLLADEDAVGVDEPPPGRTHLLVRLRQERKRRDAAEALLARREQRSDVAEPGRAEHGVDQRVGEYVAVGMACKPSWVLELDAAENERHALLEGVRVDADAHTNVSHR